MADKQAPKLKAVEREARRLERLGKLRLVEQPPQRIVAQTVFEPPKDAA